VPRADVSSNRPCGPKAYRSDSHGRTTHDELEDRSSLLEVGHAILRLVGVPTPEHNTTVDTIQSERNELKPAVPSQEQPKITHERDDAQVRKSGQRTTCAAATLRNAWTRAHTKVTQFALTQQSIDR
jgi:hypothetical protein